MERQPDIVLASGHCQEDAGLLEGRKEVNTGRTKQITGMINIIPEVLLEASGAKQSDGPEHQEALHDIGRACALRDIACLDAGVCVLGFVASITTGGMAAG